MTKLTTFLTFALTLLPLAAEDKAEPAKKAKTPPIGVLRSAEEVDSPSDVLDLKLNEAAVNLAMEQLRRIHRACFAYAKANGQLFPVGKSSNEAFRKLLIDGFVDDEKLFYISETGNEARMPDGDLGDAATGFKKTLEPGECNISYVSDLTSDRDDATLPLLFAKVTGENGNIHVIVVLIGGQAKVTETKDGIVLGMRDGHVVDIFSEKYGTNPVNIALPAKKVK